jgi:hypothetical protein
VKDFLSPLANPQSRCWPFLQNIATKLKESGRPSLGRRLAAGWFDKCCRFHQASKILFVKMSAGNGFHRPL